MPPATRYVFTLGDHDHVFWTSDEPTAEDLESAEVGLVTIVRLADSHYYGRQGKWQRMPEGRLGRAEVEGEPTRPFHAPASFFEDPAAPS